MLQALAACACWRLERLAAVVVACSGGADSTALARATAQHLEQTRLLEQDGGRPKLVLYHLDHMLRPNSGRDAQFVRQLGAELHAEVVVEQEDIAALARQAGRNVEAVGRERRYAGLLRLCSELQAAGTAGAQVAGLTAHHMYDQAETLLLRLVRGTHLTGLRGVLPLRDGCIYRPWLGVARAEILDYLRTLGQVYVEDETNASLEHERNVVRHQVMPQLAALNPAAARHLAALAELAQRTADFEAHALSALAVRRYNAEAVTWHLPCLAQPAGRYELYCVGQPWRESGVLVEYAARELAWLSGVELTTACYAALRGLQDGAQTVRLHGWRVALAAPHLLVFESPLQPTTAAHACELPVDARMECGQLSLACTTDADTAQRALAGRAQAVHYSARIWGDVLSRVAAPSPQQPAWHCVLFGEPRLPLMLRTWQAGDRIRLPGGGMKKVGDVFTDTKIPRAFRPVWAVLADAAGEVLWVPALADGHAMTLAAGSTPACTISMTQLRAQPGRGGADERHQL